MVEEALVMPSQYVDLLGIFSLNLMKLTLSYPYHFKMVTNYINSTNRKTKSSLTFLNPGNLLHTVLKAKPLLFEKKGPGVYTRISENSMRTYQKNSELHYKLSNIISKTSQTV